MLNVWFTFIGNREPKERKRLEEETGEWTEAMAEVKAETGNEKETETAKEIEKEGGKLTETGTAEDMVTEGDTMTRTAMEQGMERETEARTVAETVRCLWGKTDIATRRKDSKRDRA